MTKRTEKLSKEFSNNESLENQLKALLTDFMFDGSIIQLKSVEIEEKTFLRELKARYRNPNILPPNKNEDVEYVLPFVEKFNEKRFWWVMPESKNIHLTKGQKLVFQDGQSIVVNAGEYLDGGYFASVKDSVESEDGIINQNDSNSPVTMGEQFVYLYRNKKLDFKRENYYIYNEGDYAVKMFDKPMIRFYFHLSPKTNEDIMKWAKFIQDKFNEYRIPFGFKYPFNLKNYNYADAGVLYITQNHFPLVAPIIGEMENLFRDILQPNVPLFTLKLYDGVGFAESPFLVSESFGSHRRSLIWNIIKTKFNYSKGDFVNLDSKETISVIIDSLKEEGYLGLLYRNANTEYEYNFEKHLNLLIYKSKSQPENWHFLQESKESFEKYIDKYNNFERNRFLTIAKNYAKDLIEKAIWNPEKDTYDWLTYDQDKDTKEGYYRLVEDLEKEQIKAFLSELSIKTEDEYYQRVAYKVEINITDTVGALTDSTAENYYVDDENDKKLIDIIRDIKMQMSELSGMSSLQKEELKKKAKLIENNFERLSLPMKNDFGNYEYCPTFRGKLKTAFLFLVASEGRNMEELSEFYKSLYNTNWFRAKIKYDEWKNKVLHLSLFPAAKT